MVLSNDKPPAMLDYAPGGVGTYVHYSNVNGRAVITIPAPRGRRMSAAVSSALQVLFSLFLNELGLLLVGLAILGWWTGGAEFRVLMAAASALGVVGGALFVEGWLRYRRLDGPIVVEVTADALSFRNVSASRENHTLPRNLVYDVKFVTHSRQMVVRARGLEMFEWRPVDDDAEIGRIVALLREALGLLAARPAG